MSRTSPSGNSPHGEVVARAAADGRPLLVEAGDRHQVGPVHLLHEPLGPRDHVVDVGQPRGVDRRRLVEIDRRGHPAHQEIRVRVLAAEDRVQPDHVALPVERLEVVRHREQVHLGRQLVRRVPPVAVGEDAELPAADERLQPVLHFGEVRLRVVRPGRDGSARSRAVSAGSAVSALTTSTQSSACR